MLSELKLHSSVNIAVITARRRQKKVLS